MAELRIRAKRAILHLLALSMLALALLACGTTAPALKPAVRPATAPPIPPPPSDTPSATTTPEPTTARLMQVREEIVVKLETAGTVELRRTVQVYSVPLAPPLEELVKVRNVEADDPIEILKVEITPGVGPPGGCRGPDPCPPRVSFTVVAFSRNNGPAATVRTQITIEDPLTGEQHTTHVDEFVDGGAMTGPRLGFIVEPKRWVADVEVGVVP